MTIKVRHFPQISLSLILGTLLSMGYAPHTWAGSEPVNGGGEGSSTGTFSPTEVTITLTPSQVIAVTQTVLSQLSVALGSDSNFASNLEAQLSGPSLSIDAVQAVISAIQSVLSQANDDQAAVSQRIIRSRRPSQAEGCDRNSQSVSVTSASSDCLSATVAIRSQLRNSIVEAGGSPETADLTLSLIDQLEVSNSSSTTIAIAELALNLQGLAGSDGATAQKLTTSIDAFNRLVNLMEPETLERASEDPQVLAIKKMLVSFSEAIASR